MWEQLNLRDIPNEAMPAVEAPPVTGEHPENRTPAKYWEPRLILGGMTLGILFCLNTSAWNYFDVSEGSYGIFWPRRNWLYFHVLAGTVAILIGPVQFWPGVKQAYPGLHRVLGVLYVASIGVGGGAAYYLALHTDFGWMFSVGMGSMTTAWVISAALATVAICRQMIEQHREWMVRSYVLTLGFVLLRLTGSILDTFDVGTIRDRFTFASWIAWSVPLMLTEVILQGRKVLASREKQEQRIEAPSPQTMRL